MKSKRIEGILLAAGESRRMGFPKPLLRLNEETFLNHIAASMLVTVERLIIVVGAHRDAVTASVSPDNRIGIIENPDYKLGQLSSIKAGLRAVSTRADAVIVHLVDHPTVLPGTFGRLAGEYQLSMKPIVIARCRGHRGHPVLFDRSIFDELQRAPTDIGARAVVNANVGRVVYVDVDDPGILLDLDTPADLARAGLPGVPSL
ncbi:MAG: nucleotidyltransferase family protein [Deltaproteobacteria bacterium]|nr:nucleotidyltransferase family protein [Deltaproteobacteria bacterium]MBV8453702.1 nucleotidyltransferase family protein [Deltaproteobacteria bacterium]